MPRTLTASSWLRRPEAVTARPRYRHDPATAPRRLHKALSAPSLDAPRAITFATIKTPPRTRCDPRSHLTAAVCLASLVESPVSPTTPKALLFPLTWLLDRVLMVTVPFLCFPSSRVATRLQRTLGRFASSTTQERAGEPPQHRIAMAFSAFTRATTPSCGTTVSHLHQARVPCA